MADSNYRWRGDPVPAALHQRLSDGELTEADWDWIEANRESLTIQQFGAINGAVQEYIKSHEGVEVRPFAEFRGRDGYHEALPLDVSEVYTPTHHPDAGAPEPQGSSASEQAPPLEPGDEIGPWRVSSIDDGVVTLLYLGESNGEITVSAGAGESSENLRLAAETLAERSGLLDG